MRRVLMTILAGALSLGLAQAQRKSPHDKVSATIAGKTITIDYGRPYVKGREIFGAKLPYGQPWRLGADEATTLTTAADLQIGSLKVPKGSYTLFALPGKTEWSLIVNKQTGQWGTVYKPDQDLGRVPMTVKSTPDLTEQMTLTIESGGGNKATLRMKWEKTDASVEFTVLP